MNGFFQNFYFLLLLVVCFLMIPAESPARSWSEICSSGKLRVLINNSEREDSLPKALHRIMMPVDRERALLKTFARWNDLTVEYVEAPTFSALFTMLNADKGDLIAANLSVTPKRLEQFLLSTPYSYTREMVFTSSMNKAINGSAPNDLIGFTGWILPGTSYEDSIRSVVTQNKKILCKTLPVTISHDALLDSVAKGKIAYSILNECDIDAWLAYRKDVRKMFPVRSHVPLVFAARKDSNELINALNKYLMDCKGGNGVPSKKTSNAVPVVKSAPKQTAKNPVLPAKSYSSVEPSLENVQYSNRYAADMDDDEQPVSTADLYAIRKRGYIRVLTTNDVVGCYLQQGEVCGFEYELAKRFGDSLGVMTITVIPADFSDLVQQLKEGKGDFIAANFTRSSERIAAYPELTFCAPYMGVRQVLIGRPHEKITK